MQYIDLTAENDGTYTDENTGEEFTRVSFADTASAPDCCNCGGKADEGYVSMTDSTVAICEGCAVVYDPENPYNL